MPFEGFEAIGDLIGAGIIPDIGIGLYTARYEAGQHARLDAC